jgi:NADPH2:quinone reductase
VLPEPSDGQVLLRTVYLSLDPYMRGRMSAAKSYAPPVPVGDAMVGGTVSQVMQSCCPELKVGMYVLSAAGWQSHSIAEGASVTVLNPTDVPLSTALGVRGMPGFTAYSGLLKIGRPQPGETVVVAAASGPVGSAVGQIAKIRGARAVGIAGGPRKCAYLLDELGFDSAVDHSVSLSSEWQTNRDETAVAMARPTDCPSLRHPQRACGDPEEENHASVLAKS